MKKLVKVCVLSALALMMVSVPMIKNNFVPVQTVSAEEPIARISLRVDEANKTLYISGKGIFTFDSVEWEKYKGKVDKVIMEDGITGLSGTYGYPLEGLDIRAIAIPDSCTTFDLHLGHGDGGCVMFLYSENNTAAREAIPQDGKNEVGWLNYAWEKFGYKSWEEIYRGSTTTTYGVKAMSGQKRFITKPGVAWDWAFDGENLYYSIDETGRFITDRTMTLDFSNENGEDRESEFTFDKDGKVIGGLPRMMMASTIDSRECVPVYVGKIDLSKSGMVKEGENTYFYKDGKKQSGMQIINDKKYFFDEAGVMEKSGWFFDGSNMYYLNDNGAAVVNCWRLWDGNYFYLGSDGKMKSDGWLKDYGNWYYLNYEGRLTSQWAKLNGKWYWFGGSGKMMSNGWLKLKDGKWYYFDASGAMVSNRWVKSGNKWYYLTDSGAMAVNTRIGKYRVDKNGAWVK